MDHKDKAIAAVRLGFGSAWRAMCAVGKELLKDPKDKDIEAVRFGSGPDWRVLRVLGKEVYIPFSSSRANGFATHTTNLDDARYVEFIVAPLKHKFDKPKIEIRPCSPEALSEKARATLVKYMKRINAENRQIKEISDDSVGLALMYAWKEPKRSVNGTAKNGARAQSCES